jgi:hypothetical protein
MYFMNSSSGALLARLGILHGPPEKIVSYLIELLPLSLLYILALRLVRKRNGDGKGLAWILIFGLLFRLLLIPREPFLSSDIYRYLWDGRVQAIGHINPYLYSVRDEHLNFLRDEQTYPLVNRKEAPTVYPAGAQLLFRTARLAGLDTPAKLKSAALAAESLTLLFLLLILKRLALAPSRILIYAWNPLVIYELFHSGHLESLMLAPTMAFVYLSLQGRFLWAGALLGLAGSIKLIPALLLITIPRGQRVKSVAALLSILALVYLPYAGAKEKILGFLPTYFSDPREIFNPGFLQIGLLWAARALGLPSFAVRYALLLFLIALLIPIVRRQEEAAQDFITKIYQVLSCYIFLIYPALHPWYLSWLIPLLCLIPSCAWLYLSLALPLSYLKYLSPDGAMSPWVVLVQYAPLYALLVVESIRKSQWSPETPRFSFTKP